MSAAMLAAKKGRDEQLQIFERYSEGNKVSIFSHQGKEHEADPEDEVTKLKEPRVPQKIQFSHLALLMHAASTSDSDAVESLLASGVDPNMSSEDGLTALHQCCIENSIKVATILVENGANVNARDKDWWTPLHAASACGHWRIVNYLLSHGADVTAVNSDGDLPVDLAEGDKTTSILTDEMKRNEIDEARMSVLRKAPEAEFNALVDSLLASDFDLNSKDESGICLIHVACCNAYLAAAKKLLDANADPNVQDPEGNTSLHLAVVFDHYKVVELLSKYAIDPSRTNKFNETALVLTEDPMFIRLIKSIKTTEKLSSLTSLSAEEAGGSRRRLNSSVQRKTNAAKSGTRLAKLDAASEGKKIESNYAALDFGNKAGKADAVEDDDEKKSSLKSGAPGANYAQLDFSRKGDRTSLTPQDGNNKGSDYAELDLPASAKKSGESETPRTTFTPSTPTQYSQIDFGKAVPDSAGKPKTFVVDVGKDDVVPSNPHVAKSSSRKGSLAPIALEEQRAQKPKGSCCTIS